MSEQTALLHVPTLPWIRDAAELPGPLPTRAQIEAATTVFPSIYDASFRRTVLVNGNFVVKYGPTMSENEGHALLLVEKTPQARAPLLYAVYREDDVLYLVMEHMPGKQLSEVWSSLTSHDKTSVVDQLRLATDALRSIPSPGFYGGALGGPIPHRFFFSMENDPRITGPFLEEKDVGNALALRSLTNWESIGRRSYLSEFFARHIPKVLTGHRPTFTHADFQRKNILVQEEECPCADGSTSQRTTKVTAILDWESAGWYPDYWGYASCFMYFTWSDDWSEKVEDIFAPCLNEAALLKIIAQDLDS